jgi:acetoacetyl-CoA synthetase
MAAYQLTVVRSVQSRGPYCLLGFSLGGLLAMELAQLLLEAGETVAFLGLLDPNLPERLWPVSARRDFLLSRAKSHIAALRALSRKQTFAYLLAHAKPLFSRLQRLIGLGGADAADSPYYLEGLPAGLGDVREASLTAFYAYDIAYYPGKVTLFKAEGGDPLSVDPLKVFPQHMREHEVFISGGDHATMLRQPHVGELGADLNLSRKA